MDLSEIERKLGSGEYEMSKGFISDVFLMFNNCRLYNGPESGEWFTVQYCDSDNIICCTCVCHFFLVDTGNRLRVLCFLVLFNFIRIY